MANKNVFKSAQAGKAVPVANTVNKAGGAAYLLSEKAALAQYAATGTFNDTFYSTAEAQVSEVLAILAKVDVEFIGKVAMYARTDGRMKDMPALLCAHLATRGNEGLSVLKSIFLTVIDNGKMLRNFVQIMRSGVVGRKSLGTCSKNLVRAWFHTRNPEAIFRQSVGNDPSMADVIKLAHVDDQKSPERMALFAYMLGKTDGEKYNPSYLPPLIKEYEAVRKDPGSATSLPKVPFEMLTGIALGEKQWKMLAEQASWTQIRMNLNTFARHGVFKSEDHVKIVAAKLADAQAIEKAKPFPYQLFTTYLHTSTNGEEAIPVKIRNALHDALEVAVKNVFTYEGKTHIAVDVSGSMSSAATGYRKGATSVTRCIDVASLIACTFLKKNKESEIFPFDTRIHRSHDLEPNDSIMTNADRLRKYGGGGTDCGLVLHYLNQNRKKGDLVIYVSDSESWFDNGRAYGGGTAMANEWAMYKAANPKAKLVCIDLAQDNAVQVKSDGNVLNIGGFSDSIWEIIKKFVEGAPSADYWVDTIEKIQLPAKA